MLTDSQGFCAVIVVMCWVMFTGKQNQHCRLITFKTQWLWCVDRNRPPLALSGGWTADIYPGFDSGHHVQWVTWQKSRSYCSFLTTARPFTLDWLACSCREGWEVKEPTVLTRIKKNLYFYKWSLVSRPDSRLLSGRVFWNRESFDFFRTL